MTRKRPSIGPLNSKLLSIKAYPLDKLIACLAALERRGGDSSPVFLPSSHQSSHPHLGLLRRLRRKGSLMPLRLEQTTLADPLKEVYRIYSSSFFPRFKITLFQCDTRLVGFISRARCPFMVLSKRRPAWDMRHKFAAFILASMSRIDLGNRLFSS